MYGIFSTMHGNVSRIFCRCTIKNDQLSILKVNATTHEIFVNSNGLPVYGHCDFSEIILKILLTFNQKLLEF